MVRRQQRHPRDRRRRDAGRGVRGRRARVRPLGEATVRGVEADRAAAADTPRRRHRQARRRADRDPRRQPRRFRASTTTSWRWISPSKVLGGEGANRLHRVLRSERGLTYGASADFNALKQTGDIVAQTNTRSADDRRDAAPDDRRVLEAAARSGRRARARRGAGVPDRLVPADDRDAEPDRAPDPERGLLRPEHERPADLPRARQRRHGGRRAARGARVPASRQADRSSSSATPRRS